MKVSINKIIVLILFALTILSAVAPAFAVEVSDEVGGTSGGSDSWTNNIVAVNLTASNSGTLTAIGINWESGGTFNCELCLYNTTNETETKMPGKLIASSDYVASPNLGWEYRLMNGSNATAIIAGTTYWASWTCSGAKKAYFNTLVSPGTTRIKNIGGGNCPATYPADAGPNTQQTNMRINYTLEETTTTSEETTTSLTTTTSEITTTTLNYNETCSFGCSANPFSAIGEDCDTCIQAFERLSSCETICGGNESICTPNYWCSQYLQVGYQCGCCCIPAETTSTTIKPYGDCCPDISGLLTPSCSDSNHAKYFGEFQNKSYEVISFCPYGCDPKTGCNPNPLWLDFGTIFGIILIFGGIIWFIIWVRRR